MGQVEAFPVSGFRLVSRLGGGTQSRVWRARHLETQRLVALKLFPCANEERAKLGARLRSAASRLASVHAPGLVRVHGVVEAEAGLALVLELVPGEALSRVLQRNVRLAPEKALALALALADAYAALHAAGLAGGPVEPARVLVTREGRVRVAGLGLDAPLPPRFAPPGEGIFSPHLYAAPELLASSPPSVASDLFALGALTYHMLTGLPPARARTLSALKLERTEALHWPRGTERLPETARLLVVRLTARDPAARPASAAEAGDALALLLEKPRGAMVPGVIRPEESSGETHLDLLPEEPVKAGALPEPGAARTRRLPRSQLALAAVAATAVALAVLLYALRDRRETSTENAPPVPTAGARPSEPALPAPVPEAKPGERKFHAVVEVLERDRPKNLAPIREALAEIAREHHGTVWGLRAQIKLVEIEAAEEAARSGAIEELLDRARALAERDRFGEALDLIAARPARMRGGALDAGATDAERDLRARGRERYAEIDAKARELTAAGEFAAARELYASVSAAFGLEPHASSARARVEEVVREEEAHQHAVALRALQAARREAERAWRSTARGAFATARAFDHDAALEAVDAFLARERLPDALAARARAYRQILAAEPEQIRRADHRLRVGAVRSLEITFANAPLETYVIRGLSAGGIVYEERGVEKTLRWAEVYPARMIPYVFGETLDRTDGEEFLILASIAQHQMHGRPEAESAPLRKQRDNALTVARSFRKVRARAIALEALLKSVSADAAAEPGGKETDAAPGP